MKRILTFLLAGLAACGASQGKPGTTAPVSRFAVCVQNLGFFDTTVRVQVGGADLRFGLVTHGNRWDCRGYEVPSARSVSVYLREFGGNQGVVLDDVQVYPGAVVRVTVTNRIQNSYLSVR